MGVKYIVQGAVCSCLYGSATDTLKVKTQSKVYLNDKDGAKKLAVTTTDLGATFEKNCFGSCSKKIIIRVRLPLLPGVEKNRKE